MLNTTTDTSAIARQHNLPLQATLFVGRQDELGALATLLSNTDMRLITILAPGGMGKTRLALEAARMQVGRYADGVFFVPLAPLTNISDIMTMIAENIGLRFYDENAYTQQLIDFLRERSLLLVLDNFEHLLDAATLMSDILQSAPKVKILITSRERLNLLEEWVLELNGLDFPVSETDTDLEAYSAVQLFVQSAQRIHSGFTLTDMRKLAVSRICRQVGGMPLGIELAAAWVRVLPCEQLADEIARSLEILETSTRNMPPRHRSMRAVFAPTWERLSQVERDVFMKLSMFRGGFTRHAADQVAGASLQILSSLADKSLLRMNSHERYDLHELLRQYGEEQLTHFADTSELDNLRKRHADYYMALAEMTDSPTPEREGLRWDRLEVENANFRVALAWSQTSASGRTTGLRLALALVEFWQLRAYLNEGRAWLTGVLACFEVDAFSEPLTEVDHARLAWALSWLGLFDNFLGDLDASQSHYEESLTMFRGLGDTTAIAEVLSDYGMLFQMRGDFQRANAVLEESLKLTRELGNPFLIAWCLHYLGTLAYTQANEHQARTFWEDSLIQFRIVNLGIGIGCVLTYLAMVALDQNDPERASIYLAESLTKLRELDEVWMTVRTLEVCARLAAVEGQLRQNVQSSLIRSARIFGAADLLRETLHSRIMPFERHSYDRGLAVLRAQLDEAVIVVAWAEGRAMTRHQIVAYALDGLSRPIGIISSEQVDDSAIAQPRTSGHHRLTESLSTRELDVLRLIAQGLTNPEIAERLGVGESTVKKHINHLYSKLDVQNRTQAVLRAQAWKLV